MILGGQAPKHMVWRLNDKNEYEETVCTCRRGHTHHEDSTQ